MRNTNEMCTNAHVGFAKHLPAIHRKVINLTFIQLSAYGIRIATEANRSQPTTISILIIP